MDLGAFANIDTIEEIAKANGIECPRLRGYRLMKDEEPVPENEIKKMIQDSAVDAVKNLCEAEPFWSMRPDWYTWSSWTDVLKDYYLVKNPGYKKGDDKDDNYRKQYIGIRWDRIHGWKRRVAKFAIKKKRKRILNSMNTFNKYVGREDVLYIHARIGGGNWPYYRKEVENQPWFIEKVDDYFDSTYCDIYARIKTE